MDPSVRAPALAGLGTANRQWSTNDEDDDNDIEASDYDDQKEEALAPEALEPEALAPTAHDDWIAGDSVTNDMLDAEQQRSLCTSGASAPADAPCEPVTGVITGDDLRRARSQHGLPGGGLWFFRQTPMLDAMKRRGAGFPVAWQTRKKDSNEVTFMYGLYEDVEGFFAEMRKCPEGARYGFELIPDLRECVAYADLEWEGEEDAEHIKMRHVIKVVRSVFEKAHNRKAEVYVCSSTRRKRETWKNSYHLIVKNLVFKTNHGAMKRFWQQIKTLLSDAGCYWDNKDKQTHILDMGVYTRNRLIRLPLCSKRGGTPFKRINGDPFDENDALTSVYEDGEIYQGFLPFVVSGPRADGDMLVIIPDDDSRQGPSKGSSIVIGKRLRDDEHGANKRQTKTPIDTSEEEGKCRREGATSPSVAIRPDEYRFKIEEITALLVKIHPDQGGVYTDWWKVLCAVKNEMKGAGGDEVYRVLDAFSSIRAGYKDAGDVRTRYDDIPLRDSSQNRSTIGTLVHLGREYPALNLDSSITPEREQYDALRKQLCHTDADGHATEALRMEVRRTLLELLFGNADLSKTSWRFFAQCCSCLAVQDRSHVQSRILDSYTRINVSISEEELELVFRPVKSGLYRLAVMKHVKDELLGRLQSGAGDKIVPKRGRAGKIDTAKLLVQVPPSIVELSGAQIRQHLKEPDEEKELQEAFRTCLSLDAEMHVEKTFGGDDAEMHAEKTLGGDDAEMQVEKTLGGDDAEIASGAMVEERRVLGGNDLSSIVTAHTVLRLKDKHARDQLRPDEMHKALIKSIEPSVDWRLVVAWFGLVILYQTGCRIDAEDTRKEKVHRAEKGKKGAQNEAQTAADKSKKEAESFKAGADFSSADEGNNHSEELAGEVAETLPEVLEDYYRESTSALLPSAAEFEACWKQTRSRLLFRATPSQRKLVGRALCSVLFDKLFSYLAVKQQFEKTHMKIRDQKAFAALDSQGNLNIHAPNAISTYDQNLKYWTPTSEPTCYKRAQFVPEWLQDPHVREYARIDSIPPSRDGTSAPEDVYNTWPGFRADSLPAVAESDVLPLVKPILDHLRDVITGPDHLDFLVAWLAQQVQDPADITRVAIVLQGKQGVGKNMIFDFYIDSVLGAGSRNNPIDGAGYRTAKPSEDVFGKHSTAQQNKVFIMVDEIHSDEMRPLMNKLKDRITGATVNINPKNKTEYTVCNLCNFMFTTNDMNPLRLESEERRFVVFGCKGCKKGNAEYFKGLKTHLCRDDVARAFLQYLREVDVRKFLPFEAHRPQTEAYFAMQRRSIPLFYKFLSSVVTNELRKLKSSSPYSKPKGEDRKAKMFFDEFVEWGRQGLYNTKTYTLSGFGAEAAQLISELDAVDPDQLTFKKKKKDHGMVYIVDWPKLQKFLERTQKFDPQAAE